MRAPAGPSYGGPQTDFHKTGPSRAFIGQTPAGLTLVYCSNLDSLGPLPKGSPLLDGHSGGFCPLDLIGGASPATTKTTIRVNVSFVPYD